MFSEIKRFFNSISGSHISEGQGAMYDYCTRCGAALPFQKGYEPHLKYWTCKGCGMLLYNPNSDIEDGVTWFCDECGAILNEQEGFSEEYDEWACTVCGYKNPINENEIFLSEDEYIEEKNNPLRGLSDEDAIKLSFYEEIGAVDGKNNVIIVEDRETGQKYVKKILSIFDQDVYEYIKKNPIKHVPHIVDVFKSERYLIVIEEYISGKTVDDTLKEGTIKPKQALDITQQICLILEELHSCKPPIVHRDIKPANVMISDSGEVFLLDINAAKWIKKDETEDTHMMGTQYYAAPEQYGFGSSGSSEKTDIYALGIFLNKMITGKYPKDCKAPQPIGEWIDRCTDLNVETRCGTRELYDALERMKNEIDG